jgi:SnoaL-like domain
VPLTIEDRLVIADLVALQGHLFDDGELERLDELFTADVVYDASDFGQPPMHGIDAIRTTALALGDRNPVAHHVTNIVVIPIDDDAASVRSKGFGVAQNGTIGSVTYVDRVTRTATGWRISHRQIQARSRPLNGRGSRSMPPD